MITYENRFLYSLVLLIQDFIVVRTRNSKGEKAISKGKNEQYAIYNAKTNYKREKITLNFEYRAERIEGEDNKDDINSKTNIILEGLKNIKQIPLYKELEAAKVILVKSPLKMTNVLLKNVNYQYCVKLWNYLNDNFDLKNKATMISKNENEKGLTKKLMDQDFLLKYMVLNRVNAVQEHKSNGRKIVLSKEEQQEVTNHLIKQIIKVNPEMAEKELQKMIAKKYIQFKKVYEISMKPIENKFNIEFEKYLKGISKNVLK